MWPVLLGDVHDDRFQKRAETAWPIDAPHKVPSAAIRKSVRVRNIARKHHLAAANQVHDITETLECFGRLLACLLGTTVLRLDPVYRLVILLHHPSQLTPVPGADVFAPGAEPHGLIFDIFSAPSSGPACPGRAASTNRNRQQ